MSGMEPKVYRGYLGLFGCDHPDLESRVAELLEEAKKTEHIPEAYYAKRKQRDGEGAGHHLTILTKAELRRHVFTSVKPSKVSSPATPLPPTLRALYPTLPLISLLGVAKIHTDTNPVYFIPSLYPSGALFRKRLNLPQHPFHITLAFADHDESHTSEREWAKLIWIYRDGAAAQQFLEDCEQQLKNLSSNSRDKDLANVIAETVIDLCSNLLNDDQCMLAFAKADTPSAADTDASQAKVDLLCLRSRIRGRLKAYDASLSDALEAFSLAPKSVLVHSRVAAAYMALGDEPEAAKYVIKGLSMSPSDALLLNLAARVGVDPTSTSTSTAATNPPPLFPIKFPRTPHLLALSPSITRDDLILHPSDTSPFLLPNTVTLEEKIDGANLGIALHPTDGTPVFRNRGKIITEASGTQWQGLGKWSEGVGGAGVRNILQRIKGGVVFGEWMRAVHSVEYEKLPGWFVLFDIWEPLEDGATTGVGNKRKRNAEGKNGVYDGGRFWSARRRDELVREVCGDAVPVVSCVGREVGLREVADVLPYLGRVSAYGNQKVEGVYVRKDTEDGMWLERRAKVVAEDFVQAVQEGGHWSKKAARKNKLRFYG
ncbi:hypothetical protein HK097_008376 [Rhizophlyctis rosea]|uniref:RNA ligase domain-containing protein n=1 Tax=Rhizophlyctis rosea TaxID=64517 RepID=A0AAD5SDI7_9FUNG|nr:hypothetical protein HK097_008376 [Rhizophlyctis rosea]